MKHGLDAGLTQMVILGAGFDMRALRLPEVERNGVATFEIDTSEQLDRKATILKDAGVTLPASTTYVPIDFVRTDFEEALASALKEHGFDPDLATVFVWEGVIGYIDAASIDRSLRFMARVGGPGSRLVFTYGFNDFEPEGVDVHVRRAGFTSFEGLGLDEVWRRYMTGEPHPAAWTSKVGTARTSV